MTTSPTTKASLFHRDENGVFTFKYVDRFHTDVRKTFAKARQQIGPQTVKRIEFNRRAA